MQWRPISSLTPGKLAFLLFDHMQSAQWVGYVDEDGVCLWPEKVRGLRPTVWQDVMGDLTRPRVAGE